MMDTKIEIVGISVDLMSCKNTYTTTMTKRYRSISDPDDRMDGGIQELVGVGKHHKLCPFGQIAAEVIEYLVYLIDGA